MPVRNVIVIAFAGTRRLDCANSSLTLLEQGPSFLLKKNVIKICSFQHLHYLLLVLLDGEAA